MAKTTSTFDETLLGREQGAKAMLYSLLKTGKRIKISDVNKMFKKGGYKGSPWQHYYMLGRLLENNSNMVLRFIGKKSSKDAYMQLFTIAPLSVGKRSKVAA